MTLRALQQHLEMLQNSGIGEIYREAKDKAALLAKLKLQHSTCTLCRSMRAGSSLSMERAIPMPSRCSSERGRENRKT